MRDFLLPLVLIAVVVAGVWIYFEVTAAHGGPVQATAPAPGDTSVPPPPPKAVRPTPKIVAARNSAKIESPPAPASAPIVSKLAAPLPALRPIPTGTPEQVNPGMEESKVVELLGQPDLTLLSIRRGSLSETYIYKKKTGENLALIHLEGGKVVSPQSGPALPQGRLQGAALR